MASSTGNAFVACKSNVNTGSPSLSSQSEDKTVSIRTVSKQERILFHDKLRQQSRCDLETPASIIANVNIKQLLTPAAFDCLPTKYQNELIKLLPETDRISVNDDVIPVAMTVNALSNEFFAKSCVEYRDRLRNGEFTPSSTNSRAEYDPVIWECDSNVLTELPQRSDIPKAGDAFICTSKRPSRSEQAKLLAKSRDSTVAKKASVNKLKKAIRIGSEPSVGAKSQSVLKSTKPLPITSPKPVSQPAVVVAQKAVSNPKTVSNLKPKEIVTQSIVTGVKRPRPETHTIIKPVIKVPTTEARSSPNSNQMIVTKFRKVTENGSVGEKIITKVVPIVVRNPHGQVVTTLANCNPLLTQMIRNPVNSQTYTTVPIRVEKKQSLLPTILKRNNPVIVTLRNNPNIITTKNGVNKAVTDVISKVKTTENLVQPISNGNSQPKPVIVTVTGSNGSIASRLITTAVNLERSKQCDSSKQGPPTLNLERSYQICKQVLGKTEGATIVVVGHGGKKKIISKPVRSRNADPTTGSNNNTQCSSDIPIYRNKHRGGKSTLTLSGHVFLALKTDDDGYTAKAYKRKTAFKQKHKKKLNKVANKKTLSQVSSSATTVSQNITGTDSVASTTATTTSLASKLTTVTDTLHASQPVLSITESSTKVPKSGSSLLDSCMCSKRALIICRKCGAFCHAECTAKDHCLACLVMEK